MKKNTIKAFTLVEMLIVIVIIWILIASLMPRMQQAQARARDVGRKNDLAKVQTAIISYLWDTGKLPECPDDYFTANSGCTLDKIEDALKAGGLDVIPKDPTNLDYLYGVAKRNGHDDQWFRLAANMEVGWTANFVFCDGVGNFLPKYLKDTATFKPCKEIKVVDNNGDVHCSYDIEGNNCIGYDGYLWYVVTY